MGLKFKNALIAFSLLLLFTVFTSCQKDHDLVSSYVIKSSLPKVEAIVEVPKGNEVHNNAINSSEEKEEITEGPN